MKASTSSVALGLLLSFSAPCAVAMAADPGEQLLLERAAFWRAQQRLDLAAETLNKVLALNPNQSDALYQLGLLAMQRGDRTGAQTYFDRVRQMAASDSHAAELARSLAQPAPRVAAAPTAAPQPTASVQANSMVANPRPATAAVAQHTNPPSRDLPELAAISADSDDLTSVTPPAVAAPTPATHALAAGNGQTARNVQLASLGDTTISDATAGIPATAASVRQAGSADLGITAEPTQTAQLELMPPPPVGGYQRPATATPYSPSDTLEMDIDRNLAQLQEQSNPSLLGGFGFRWHDGTSGLNSLTEYGTPVEGSFSPWYTGTARFAVLPVYLDAGSISSSNLNLFGANPMLTAKGLPLVNPGGQNASGVGLLGGYTWGDFTGQVGTSPLGFPVTNLVGMAAYAPKFWDNTLTVRFEGLRQPVTDSVLSYAGTHASLSAANSVSNGAFGNNGTWGGVVKTGGNISAFYDDQMYGGYGSVEYATLTGENVADNSEIDALLGAYFRPWKTENNALRVGISGYYAGYDKNLGGFTFGQGGYFSPQNFIAVTFPVEFTGHDGPWSYLASAALGVQHFNQDSTPIFPNNINQQSALETAIGSSAFIGGSTGTGLAASVKGQIEYAIDNSTAIGAAASFDNGNNYNEVIAKIYLRKTFDWFSPVASSDPTAIARRDQPQSRL
jgi:cellulose synthase operon protein C